MYKYIHTCIYIHISCPHTYTHTHIYTHAYKMYIWTHAKHVWNDGAAALRGKPNLTPRSSALLPVRITTARRPDHIRLSAQPIHPVHCPCQLPAWPWPPETRSFFCHFGGVLLQYVWGSSKVYNVVVTISTLLKSICLFRSIVISLIGFFWNLKRDI